MREVRVREHFSARTGLGLGAIAIILALCTGYAHARPGGGGSFSGGGGGRSGGGVGGGGGVSGGHSMNYDPHAPTGDRANPLPFFLFVFVCGIGFYVAFRRRPSEREDHRAPSEPVDLSDVQRRDPAFSPVAFEDFAFRLFSAAHRSRHSRRDLTRVAPYIGLAAREALFARAPSGAPMHQVIVGAQRIYRAEVADRIQIGVEYVANVANVEHTYYSVERWLFSRDANVHSKPPAVARTFPCPNCGAPWQADQTGGQVCASCHQIVDNGRFDWQVESIKVRELDERPPTLTIDLPEHSAELPTIIQPDVHARWRDLELAGLTVNKRSIDARLSEIYNRLNHAWSNNDLRPVRNLVSDGLYDYLQYWIGAYRQQGLRNQLADMQLTSTKLTRIESDRYFDAITIRIFATGKDVTIHEADGKRVLGSAHRKHAYSEYWTLIRTTKAADGTPACDHCGGALAADHAGACTYCGAFVTVGKHDWILAKIEQADTYLRRAR